MVLPCFPFTEDDADEAIPKHFGKFGGIRIVSRCLTRTHFDGMAHTIEGILRKADIRHFKLNLYLPSRLALRDGADAYYQGSTTSDSDDDSDLRTITSNASPSIYRPWDAYPYAGRDPLSSHAAATASPMFVGILVSRDDVRLGRWRSCDNEVRVCVGDRFGWGKLPIRWLHNGGSDLRGLSVESAKSEGRAAGPLLGWWPGEGFRLRDLARLSSSMLGRAVAEAAEVEGAQEMRGGEGLGRLDHLRTGLQEGEQRRTFDEAAEGGPVRIPVASTTIEAGRSYADDIRGVDVGTSEEVVMRDAAAYGDEESEEE